MSEWVVGQTYTREELNTMMGVPEECDCSIITPDHVCEGRYGEQSFGSH